MQMETNLPTNRQCGGPIAECLKLQRWFDASFGPLNSVHKQHATGVTIPLFHTFLRCRSSATGGGNVREGSVLLLFPSNLMWYTRPLGSKSRGITQRVWIANARAPMPKSIRPRGKAAADRRPGQTKRRGAKPFPTPYFNHWLRDVVLTLTRCPRPKSLSAPSLRLGPLCVAVATRFQ
jgi:hypothetical protein